MRITWSVPEVSRFLFSDAVEQAALANPIAIFETKVVDEIDHPRAVYTDNYSHFKSLFTEHPKDKGDQQLFAPIISPSSVGLAERYVQLFLSILRAVLQHYPALIFEWDTMSEIEQSTLLRATGPRTNPRLKILIKKISSF